MIGVIVVVVIVVVRIEEWIVGSWPGRRIIKRRTGRWGKAAGRGSAVAKGVVGREIKRQTRGSGVIIIIG